jgi:hypothetical protein
MGERPVHRTERRFKTSASEQSVDRVGLSKAEYVSRGRDRQACCGENAA